MAQPPTITQDMMTRLLDFSPDASLVVDTAGTIVLLNAQAAALFGYAQEDLLGQPLEVLLPQHLHRVHVAERLHYLNAPRTRPMGTGLNLVGRHKDGSTFPVDISLRPFLVEQQLHVMGAIRDMTAGRQAAQERAHLTEQLQQQNHLATHELRNPVTVLAGYADLLLRRAAQGKGHGLDKEQRDTVSAMKEAAQQLAKLTEDLLDVTRLQAGHFPLQRTPTELIALARHVITDLQATTHHHQITLQTSCPALWASVDPLRVEQILSNVLSNAIKYSPKAGPIEVRIWENEQTREACFSVRDYGMGIPRAQQAHIFGRFVRAENVRMAHIRGTGLYLCRELVERHGGQISFQSEEQVGSTFVFTLSLERVT